MAALSARQRLGVSEPFEQVEIDGMRVAYRQEGAGSDIVCLHAIGHGGGDYDGIVAPLAKRHRVTVLDWPNHGWSDDDTQPPSVDRYAQVLARFLATLNLQHVVAVGNSIGGGAAIRFAHLNSNNVRALVLANPAGLVTPSRATKIATRAMEWFFSAGVARRWWFVPRSEPTTDSFCLTLARLPDGVPSLKLGTRRLRRSRRRGRALPSQHRICARPLQRWRARFWSRGRCATDFFATAYAGKPCGRFRDARSKSSMPAIAPSWKEGMRF